METVCQFSIEQIIHHLLFDYIGVIIDVDASFQGTEEWYLEMARSKRHRDKLWNHVLVDQSINMTYLTQLNLEAESSPRPIQYPLIDQCFNRFESGRYLVEVS